MLLHIVPPSASTFAAQTDGLFVLITILTGVFFVAAEGMFFWLLFKFRAKEGVPSQYITGKEKHLKRWVTWPHFLILVCDIIIIIAAVQLWVRVKQTLPPADSTIRVHAQQWTWIFTDPGPDGVLDTADDVRTTDEVHLVVNKRYHFLLESKDVLHSFFVPAFRLKQDAIPGRIYTGWFETTRPGTYDVLCAEICGIGHGVMGAKLVVESAAEQALWISNHAHDAALAELNTAPVDTASTVAVPATAGAH
jgi:cytochrome c oxidase subunit 2